MRTIEIPNTHIQYQQGEEYTLKILAWLFGEDGEDPYTKTGLVVMKRGDDVDEMLQHVATKEHIDEPLVQVAVLDFADLIEGLSDQHRAWHVLSSFDKNVDKGEGDK